ncbi:MAG: GntR family transcriptional regulator [Victivallales bacterium]
MIITIDTHSGMPIFRQILDQISRQILTGQLKTGEQLPPIREFSAELKINPMTLSKTYSILESEGYLERRRGIGLFVKKMETSESSSVKTELAEEILKTAAVNISQLGINEDTALKIFSRHYRKYKSKMEE